MSVLAWFQLPDVNAVEQFRSLLASYDATFEGSGTREDDGTFEGYAVFPSKKKMESYAKKAVKHGYELVDYVT